MRHQAQQITPDTAESAAGSGHRLARLWQRLRQAPPQLLLVALVLVAALASGLYSRTRGNALNAGDTSEATEAPQAAASAPVVEGPTPSQPVEAAFEAARKGDLDAYLAQFTEPLKSQLARTRTEKGDSYLRDYLARLTTPIKGLAADLNRQEAVGPDLIRLPVQFIYSDRNEVQTFTLHHEGDRWRIRQVDTVRSAPVLIPYGTPIEQIR